MKLSALTALSYSVLAGAILLGALWLYANGALDDAVHEYAKTAVDAKQAAAREAAAARVSELAQNTADARAQLGLLAATDVLSAAKMAESAGELAGANLQVTSISSADVPSKNGGMPLHVVTLSFDAKGAFARLFRAIDLLDALSLPAIVDQFSLTKDTAGPDAGNSSNLWHATGRIRFLTSAALTP